MVDSIVYTEEDGAQLTTVFGCSFKNITAQMGFDDQPIVFTLTIVEEENQSFTLKDQDVRSAQRITFGALDMIGIVQAWEESTIDPQGTGIYTVKLTDCRTVLDAVQVFLSPGTNWQTNNFSRQNPEGSVGDPVDYGINVIAVPTCARSSNTNYGVPMQYVKESIESATVYYGTDRFRIDLSELNQIPYNESHSSSPYLEHTGLRVEGSSRSVTAIITELCRSFGFQWWVEASYEGNTVIIKIKVIRRINEQDQPIPMKMDDLAALHINQIIRRKDGYENRDATTRVVLQGGERRTLVYEDGNVFHQFWGWDTDGEPRALPAYPVFNQPGGTYRGTSISEMRRVLNGELDDAMDEVTLAAIKSYADAFWGRKFYTWIGDSDLDADGTPWVETIPAGWWEEDTNPANLSGNAEQIFASEDGRWKPFVQLPNPVGRWSNALLRNLSIIGHAGNLYMKCTLERVGKYVLITLGSAMETSQIIRVVGQDETTESEVIDRMTRLAGGWIPLMDRRKFYGPWLSDANQSTRVQGRVRVDIDTSLVPWKFARRGTTHSEGMAIMNEIAETKVKERVILEQIINTGQLETADIPQVNLGQQIGVAANVTQIHVQFGVNGVTTRYVLNQYTAELGKFKQKDREKTEEDPMAQSYFVSGNFDDLNQEFKTLQQPENMPSEKPESAQNAQMSIEFNKPTMGRILARSTERGFYPFERYPCYEVTAIYDSEVGGWTCPIGITDFHCPNSGEPLDSPGYLRVGEIVTLNHIKGTGKAYISQSAKTFAPPTV